MAGILLPNLNYKLKLNFLFMRYSNPDLRGPEQETGYLLNGLLTFATVVFDADAFMAASSLLLFVLPRVKVNNIMTKTGTNSNKNGEMFVNLFIIVFFTLSANETIISLGAVLVWL
jgi:hypothetical protein